MSNIADGSVVPTTREPASIDRALLRDLATGSTSAFAEIYDRHGRVVYAYAASHLEQREDAEEVSQDVFLVLWRRRTSLVIEGDSMLPWLLVTCKFTIRNRQRAVDRHERRRSFIGDHDSLPATHIGPEQAAENAELRDFVALAVSALPPADRMVFELCVQEGRSYDEAAAAAGISSAAVRNRLFRLRARLRSELGILRRTP
ncbi:sigma-70 family RNA polymerase sigma factor [Leifsonia kafniensis]|uniref:Sigma-70 family RNA polymerase sigma factor n=1 Tax=Leifsonia kafniensis TaxID=475957 RepID=A0ABP7KNK0_9MICO